MCSWPLLQLLLVQSEDAGECGTFVDDGGYGWANQTKLFDVSNVVCLSS